MNSNRKLIYIISAAFVLIFIIGLILALNKDGAKPTAKSQVDAQQKALASSPYSDPILKYLPYGDIGYKISPVISTVKGKQTLTINIEITFSGADYRSSPTVQQGMINKRESEALNYIKSKGFDPKKYRIIFNTPNG